MSINSYYQGNVEREVKRKMKVYFVLLMKSHLQSYPCPLQINSFWNLGFLLGITIILQIITGIFLGLHYTSDLNSAYSSVFFFLLSQSRIYLLFICLPSLSINLRAFSCMNILLFQEMPKNEERISKRKP